MKGGMQEEERKGRRKEECGIEEQRRMGVRMEEEGRKGGRVGEEWRRMGTGLGANYHSKRKEVGGRAQF